MCKWKGSFQVKIFLYISHIRLVCSDLISRGIDISHVSHVVSYDVPVDMRKYVHRVGRTARAGKTGEAWTLVEEHEVFILSFPIINNRLNALNVGTLFQAGVEGGRSS